jgi:hypothetical protein
MYAAMLIRKFSEVGTLPVQVEDVQKIIMASRAADEINYIGVDINAKILMGMNHTVQKTVERLGPYSDPVYCYDIYMANSLTDQEKRLVQCKELIHIWDPSWCKTDKLAEYENLVARIVLPPGLIDAVKVKDGDQDATDRVAILQALAVLFPMKVRNLLMPKMIEGKLDLDEIAGMADIPASYVAVAMSPVWDNVHNFLINLNWPAPQIAPDPSGQT